MYESFEFTLDNCILLICVLNLVLDEMNPDLTVDLVRVIPDMFSNTADLVVCVIKSDIPQPDYRSSCKHPSHRLS